MSDRCLFLSDQGALLGQCVCSLIPAHVAVGGDPEDGDLVLYPLQNFFDLFKPWILVLPIVLVDCAGEGFAVSADEEAPFAWSKVCKLRLHGPILDLLQGV